MDRDPGDPDMVRFLRTDTPLIEFHGLGGLSYMCVVLDKQYMYTCKAKHVLIVLLFAMNVYHDL